MSHPLRDLPIGVFDSGVGGLTVVQAIRDRLPNEHIIYLGDTARVPYGNKGAHTVRRYALNAGRMLEARGIKALVIACNTASAYGLDALREASRVPVLGVIEPVAAAAAARTQTGGIAVIGTRGTIQSDSYPSALTTLAPQARVVQLPCPLFVPLAEEGWVRGSVVEEVARAYFAPLREHPIPVDTMILGCTHYPILRATLASVLDAMMPRHVTLLDSAQATTRALEQVLERDQLARDSESPGALSFLVTDEPSGFLRVASTFFRGHLARPEHVDISDHGG